MASDNEGRASSANGGIMEQRVAVQASAHLQRQIRECIEKDDVRELRKLAEAERGRLGFGTSASKPSASKKKKGSKEKATFYKEDNAYTTFLRHIFFYACLHEAVNCVRLLISGEEEHLQVPVDAVDELDGRVALHHAALNQSTQCIELLFQSGANSALRSKQGLCPLEEALYSSKLKIDFGPETSSRAVVERLRAKDLNAVRIIVEKSKDQLVRVAFQLASQLQLVPLVALLLVTRSSFVNSIARGSDYTGCEDEGSGTLIDLLLGKIIRLSNLHDRIRQKSFDIAAIQAWGTSLENSPTQNMGIEESPLRKDAMRVLEAVLCFNPKLSAHPQSAEIAPLLRAAQANDGVLVGLLLGAGAGVNETDADGNTALHWVLRQATPGNRREVDNTLVKKLLEGGANVLMGNKLGATPVHTAAGHGHAEALRMILEKERSGANVLAATKETPLHYAVKNNHLECTQVLLHYGSNRHVVSLRHQRPGQLAPSPEMRALLQEPEPPITCPTDPQKAWDGKAAQWSKISGEVADGSSIAKTEIVANLPAYRTAMCRFYGTAEGCSYGSKCHFAHSEEELRFYGGVGASGSSSGAKAGDTSVKNFKTKLCQHYEKGLCPHGTKCKFAHGETELRPFLLAGRSATGRPSTASSLASSGSDDEEYTARKVFVGGLPHFIKSEELGEHFEEQFGRVRDAVVICGMDEDGSQRSRGFGFVLFEDPSDAEVAVQKHWVALAGRRVEVKRAQARIDSPNGHLDQAQSAPSPSISDRTAPPNSKVGPASVSSSAISSPQAPLSPALSVRSLRGEESVALFNDGVQLPPLGPTSFQGHNSSLSQTGGPAAHMQSHSKALNPQGGVTNGAPSGWALPPLSVPSQSPAIPPQTFLPPPLPSHAPPFSTQPSRPPQCAPPSHHHPPPPSQGAYVGNGFSAPSQGSHSRQIPQHTSYAPTIAISYNSSTPNYMHNQVNGSFTTPQPGRVQRSGEQDPTRSSWPENLYSHTQPQPRESVSVPSNGHVQSRGNGHYVAAGDGREASDAADEDELIQLLALLDPGNTAGGGAGSRPSPSSSRNSEVQLESVNHGGSRTKRGYPVYGQSQGSGGLEYANAHAHAHGSNNGGGNNSVYHLPSFNEFELSG